MKLLFCTVILYCVAFMPWQPSWSQEESTYQDPDLDYVETKDFRSIVDGLSSEISLINTELESLRSHLQEERVRGASFREGFEGLQKTMASAERINENIILLKSDIETSKYLASQAKSTAENVRWIVAVASFLVTALVVAIGILFSERFINLKADSKVAHEIMIRLEKKIESYEATKAGEP